MRGVGSQAAGSGYGRKISHHEIRLALGLSGKECQCQDRANDF
jgi:hypothetical protein